MNMSNPQSDLTFVAQRRRWFRSLYVRAALLSVVLALLTFLLIWWPRRTTWAVLQVGGEFTAPRCYDAICKPELSLPSLLVPVWEYFRGSGEWLCWDSDLDTISFHGANVDDRWMWRLGRCHRLARVDFDDIQIGPGLRALENSHVEWVFVQGANSRSRLEGLLKLRSITKLFIEKSTGPIGGLEQLREHPNLTKFSIENSKNLPAMIRQMKAWPKVMLLQIQPDSHEEFHPLTETIDALNEIPDLKSLSIGYVFSDEDFSRLAELKELEELELCFGFHNEEIVKAGLKHLTRSPKLNRLDFRSEGPAEERLAKAAGETLPHITLGILKQY